MPVLRSQTVYLSITVTLALSQQHTLLLSHVPCFVSASRCSCSLTCLALSQHRAALILMCLALSQYCMLSHVLCFVSASLMPFLLSLMCLSCLVTVLARSCILLCHNSTPPLRCLRALLFSALSCALLCPAQHHAALSSASPQHHAAHVPCLVSA